MKNKKIIAITTASILSANMIPAYLLTSFAEEPTEQNQITYTQEESELLQEPTQDTIVDENTTPPEETNTNQQEVKAEKIATRIVIVGDLNVPYTGEKTSLKYKVIGDDGKVVVEETDVIFKKNIFEKYDPVEVGKHNFKINYRGNLTYEAANLEGVLEIIETRKNITIELEQLSKVYNGQVQKPVAHVKNENGEVIGQADVDFDWKLGQPLNPGKNVGSYEFTAKFKGDKEYGANEVKGTFEVTKCKPTVKVEDKQSKYTGKPIRAAVTVSPSCGYINIYSGVNTKLNPTIYVDVNLGDDLISKAISDFINKLDINTVADLKAIFENEDFIKLLNAANINVNDIKNALKYLPDNLALSFGAPVNAGAYVSTAIVLDANAEVAVGIGSLLVAKADRKIEFTEDSLQQGEKVKPDQDYTMEAVIQGTNEKVEVKYTGFTRKGKTYSSTQAPKESGVYTATASVGLNPNYRADIKTRSFSISKSSTSIELVSDSSKIYDGNAYEPQVVIKDRNGEIVENPEVNYTYYKGIIKLKEAPSKVGNYSVRATYNGDNAHYGSTTSMKFSIVK